MTRNAVDSFVRTRIGLDPTSLGVATLPPAVEGRMRGVGSADAYAGLLASDPVEWTALLGELVVPETWFFRGGVSAFEYLARWVREWAAGRPAGRPVRILSIPCSTGEEPYSLAIALEAEGVPSAAYRIDGVELSRAHLLRAAAAQYSAFSFREAGSDPRPSCFREVEPGKWEVLPRFRDRVRFRPGNLIDPDFLAGESPYDLILCRNLFIYLTPDGRARAVANLDRLLAPDGRLCLTPTEADRLPTARFVPDGPVSLAAFRRAPVPDVTLALRSGVIPRGGLARAAPAAPAPIPAPRSGVLALAPRVEAPGKPGSGVVSMPTVPVVYAHLPLVATRPILSLVAPADPLRTGRELADAGRLEEARAVCEAATGPTPTASLFGLLGVIHLAAGRPDAAAEAFRKALYLDPDHPESLTHMIALCDKRGDAGQAAGLRRRLARLVREVPA